ncbi:ABC transporter permease, partial [Singulisphaera rosea]
MTMRWGFGPVFVLESQINARRRQVYALRSLFALVLLIGMSIVWVVKDYRAPTTLTRPITFQQMAMVGEWFFYAIAGLQVSLIMLVAPAATAGAIGMDRARGTLLPIMATDLSDTEIVLATL